MSRSIIDSRAAFEVECIRRGINRKHLENVPKRIGVKRDNKPIDIAWPTVRLLSQGPKTLEELKQHMCENTAMRHLKILRELDMVESQYVLN